MEWVRDGKGLEYREHPKRKYGFRKDRYYRGRYKVDGKQTTVSFGWESEKAVKGRESFRDMCLKQLLTLKSNARNGAGPITLKEKRELAEKQREVDRQLAQADARQSMSFGDFFEKEYWPVAQSSKKYDSYRKEKEHFKTWLNSVVGDLPFRDISQIQVETIKRNMQRSGRSPRSIEYVLTTFRQVWNLARKSGLTDSESPSDQVKFDRPDNNRCRYLSEKESEMLLECLKTKSLQVYMLSILSLDTGCRFSEVANLRWQDVDTERRVITYRDTKKAGGSKIRVVPMTTKVKELFRSMRSGEKQGLIFPDRNGNIQGKISHTFYRCVDGLRLNEGVTDPRDKVVFHTLRHTYASRMIKANVGLYVVQKLLGHSSSQVTERYSHLSHDSLSDAVLQMEQAESRSNQVIELKR
jgi:integrase